MMFADRGASLRAIEIPRSRVSIACSSRLDQRGGGSRLDQRWDCGRAIGQASISCDRGIWDRGSVFGRILRPFEVQRRARGLVRGGIATKNCFKRQLKFVHFSILTRCYTARHCISLMEVQQLHFYQTSIKLRERRTPGERVHRRRKHARVVSIRFK